jgi:hypothetical protein
MTRQRPESKKIFFYQAFMLSFQLIPSYLVGIQNQRKAASWPRLGSGAIVLA